MSKKKLFDNDSEEEVAFKTENEYAKKYDKWRQKEELYKLEQKYGSKALSSDVSVSSDSEDESDEPPEVTEEVETQFLKTLALLKTKDPRIYDPNFKFFDEKEEKKEEKDTKTKSLTFEDDDDDSDDGNIFTVEKKAEIDVKKSINKSSSDDTADKQGKLKDYLIGKAEHIDEEVDQDLAPLKALWSDPKLNEGEAFLRDYILDKKYLEEGDIGEAEGKIRDDEDLEEDERRVEEQGQFERAYNFRFEEPDQEYLKRYPRTMNYTRPKDDSRSRKRAEVRARKEEEKRRKMEDIARMKALKLKEIQDKIAKIKQVTGNEDLAFKEEDIEGDFDPEEHDQRMRALFDEEFYGGADEQKPVFPDLDEELEIENWENYEQEYDQEETEATQNEEGPHCEDEDFNMDADYDPKQARANLLEEIQSTLGKKRRNRKKKSKLAQLLTSEKPKFVPTIAEKTYAEYMEEYYKMDCEDVIGGDLPTRFKYREVVPNDFGLTVEEILLADDKELTQWVPLKKIVKHRPADVEKSEVKTYKQKAADERLKKKILPSLFKDLPEEPELVVPVTEVTRKKKKKKKNKEKNTDEHNTEKMEEIVQKVDDNEQNIVDDSEQNIETTTEESSEVKVKKKKHKENNKNITEDNSNIAEDTLKKNKHEEKNKKDTEDNSDVAEDTLKKNKKKHKQFNNNDNKEHKGSNNNESTEVTVNNKLELIAHSGQSNGESTELNKIKKKKKHKSDGFIVETVQNAEPSHTGHEGIKNVKNKSDLKRKLDQQHQVPSKKHKKFDPSNNSKQAFKTKFKQKDKFKNKQSKDKSSDNPLSKLSDERLKAYGLNPKKYRSFLKYKKF